MKYCLACHKELAENDIKYHQSCLTAFWQEDTPVLELDYELSQIETLAKENVAQLQLQLANKDLDVIDEYVLVEKSLHRCCPSCKKGVLITLLTFDSRGPPKEYKKIARRKTLKYKQ
jgi:hypothetical protein